MKKLRHYLNSIKRCFLKIFQYLFFRRLPLRDRALAYSTKVLRIRIELTLGGDSFIVNRHRSLEFSNETEVAVINN